MIVLANNSIARPVEQGEGVPLVFHMYPGVEKAYSYV